MAVFLVVAPCNLVEVYQCFRGACCLHRQGTDFGGSKHLRNVGKLYQTAWLNNSEDSRLHSRRLENLNSSLILTLHLLVCMFKLKNRRTDFDNI
jgi:hypothetical protein